MGISVKKFFISLLISFLMSRIDISILWKHLDPRVDSLDQDAKEAFQSGISMPLASPSRIEMPPWHFDRHLPIPMQWPSVYADSGM